MRIAFTQVYIEVAADFPFSYIFQHFISSEIGSCVKASEKFKTKFGPNFQLVFFISAKRLREDNEVRGPSLDKKHRDVEYTIFLPFSVIEKKRDRIKWALKYLFQGVYSVLESWDMDTKALRRAEDSLIEKVKDDPKMFEDPEV